MIRKTLIPGLLIIESPVLSDRRGFFHEVFRMDELEKATGKEFKPVQWNHSFSLPRVIRAIHTENWQKIIYPISGKMFAAFVDIRPKSRTFARVVTHTFDNTKSNSTKNAVYIAPGIGNSLCVIGKEALHYMYMVDEYWDNSKASGIAWNDSDLAIDWPVKKPIISERDRNNPTLRNLFPDRFKKL